MANLDRTVASETELMYSDGITPVPVGHKYGIFEYSFNEVVPGSGASNIFIYPPYRFKVCDAMLTNFHLPQSTLIMMVSALAGRERILCSYAMAVRAGYKFFSYGDCMLIV